ncbi:MAG: LysR family transcriptional regulator [Nitrospiraceae bacterium]|nr:LysR family transcriptional regulator [Nitrospiraceae bacterium]
MEDHRLKSYCLVVETKSFSRAAQAKHMTQSAMSRLVKSLEDELGVTLLHRKGKAAVPTPEGRLFYEHARKILEGYARMEQDLGFATRADKGVLRLGAGRTPAIHLLPEAIYEFAKTHPEIRIDLSVGRTSSVLRDLRDNKIDVGIVEGTIMDDSFSAEIIAEDEIVLIAPENHPLTKKKNITIQDLIAEPFILPEQGSGTRTLVDAFFREARLDAKNIKVRMALGSPEFVVQMVQAGMGIAFASKWSIFTAVTEGTVKLLRVPARKMKQHIYLINTDRETVSPFVNIFNEFIKGHSFFIPF